jgi:hypothetical protein
MMTLFACPKAFTDPHIATIQNNAITSWTLLRPRPDVILFGNEVGTAEICARLGLQHVPDVRRNQYGTPQLDDILAKATEHAKHEVMCYVNADIVLTKAFCVAATAVEGRFNRFLLSGGRRGLDIRDAIDFSEPAWEENITVAAFKEGEFSFFGNDYFVFSRGLYDVVPPLVIGRSWFDSWMFSGAKAAEADIIDASAVIPVIHQNHEYRHLPSERAVSETKANRRLTTGEWHSLLEANYELTPQGLRRIRPWGRKLRFRMRTLIREHVIYRTVGIRRKLHLNRVGLRGILRGFRS